MLLKDGSLLASGAPREVFRATLLEQVFDCPIEVITHPHYECPLVLATQKQDGTIN
ncbi:hypothetical protein [Fodinibius salsisoli]|uniref:Iron complex transport system ATP-binding protein n=1 Tax=Fodinibius salsisoli TaxID=2820877 RepID=A0ABT3PNX9_9BACT|nr:hypothetical protein [Fodinibius salsisoli]MCW9707550.1 hypothetical protein [Fodinibius salsisoli]